MVVGDNGIIAKAQTAKTDTNRQQLKEEVEIILADYIVEKNTKGTELTTYLEKQKTENIIENYQLL